MNKQPTHYYIEYWQPPGDIFWEIPLYWLGYVQTIDKHLIVASGVNNMLSVIQQHYDKHSSPDEKDKLTLKGSEYTGTYVFKFLNCIILTLKPAYL